MAGDWIKVRSDLADDPAVIAIAAQVGLDEFAVVGRLHTLWAWADEQSRDGHAAGVTSAWLDRKVQRDGFAAALVAVRWLEVGADGLRIPNFENHNGKTAKTRALSTRRKQVQRADGGADPVAPVVTPASPVGHAASVTKAGPEKRREEAKKPPNPRKRGSSVRFDEFWLAWPKNERRQDRGKCSEVWTERGYDEIADTILADVRKKRGTKKWAEGYIETPIVYLRNKRWEDEADAADPADLTEWWETRGGAAKKAAEIGYPVWDETCSFAEYIAALRGAITEALPA